MILKKIKLENIRSYLSEEIEFPEGSLLLSGNIGSGKSTILLAIDFVLFGLTRGILSGNALLRNGKNNGSVELNFEIDGNDVVIKRNLKRTSGSVVQDTGFVIINGNKKELSAVELKQSILELLNYPKDLLTKSKNLIYRYTVYTPQEEMKQILIGEKDVRIDTLRRVFGIDKYKRILENSDIFVSKLKEKRKEFLGRIEDLERKKFEKEIKVNKIKEIEKKYNDILPIIDKLKRDFSNKEYEFEKIQDHVKEFNEINQELEFLDEQTKEKINRSEQDNNLFFETNKIISKLQSEIKTIEKVEQIKLENLRKEILTLETREREISIKLAEFNSKINESRKLMNEVYSLENCPTCRQKVDQDHKKHIREMETSKIKQLEESSEVYRKDQEEITRKITNLKQELELLRQKDKEYEVNKVKLINFNDKKGFLKSLTENHETLKREIANIQLRKLEIEKQIIKLENVEELYLKIKKELEVLRENLKQVEIQEATLLRERKDFEIAIEELTKEILDKIKIKDSISYLIKLQEWFDNSFANLMRTMEKQVMLKVHNDFNELFMKWFNILVENENLQISLDYEFTPKIEQAGYDIDYMYLSGGIKTAAALAYRLALNQVINNLMSDIKTRDLLILDEPTDGFSDEQLDRMKLVLDELNIKQVIIVSHESKIESFVNNVIRLEKKEHVSKVV